MARRLGEPDTRGLTLVADYQERGAGRKGRSWIAPAGSALLCTVALPDALPSADLWIVPFWTALVVVTAIAEFGATAVLQWPNDLLLEGRKVAGILCVSRVIGDYAWVGCGIGVNVKRPHDSATPVAPDAAFLSDIVAIGRDQLLHAVLRAADDRYDDLSSPLRIAHAWEARAGIPGVRYCIQLDGEEEPFEATASRLLTGGALLVDRNGTQLEVSVADARILR